MKKILILMLLMMSMVFSQTAEEGFINGAFFVPNGETTLSDLLKILQSADNDGIKIRGYDDKTGDSLMINITASGSMLMISTTAMDIEAATGDVNLTATVGSIINKLGDNAGIQTFDVRDSDGNVVITANSDGSLAIDGTFSTAGGMTANQVRGFELGTPTYDDLQDWMNNTQSSGITSGGGFTDNGDGTITVDAGTGFIRATNSDIAEVLFFDWAADASLALTDNSTNYIYVDYNGGTDIVKASVTKTEADNRTKILLGKVYREGTVAHTVEAGMITTELAKRVLTYLNSVNGEIVRGTGLGIAETGTLNISMSAGTGFAGLTPMSWSSISTDGADTFEYYYYDGAWQHSTVSAIDNTQYNNYGVGLATLTANQYGVHWVYLHFDGELFVVYGLDSYTLAGAQDADAPENLPDIVADFSQLIARITIEKSEASSFTDVDSPWESVITSNTVTDHGALGGLGDDDHTQYLLVDGTRAMTGEIEIDSTPDTDHTASGIKVQLTAGETINVGDICYQNADGEIYIADATDATKMPGIFMCIETAADGVASDFLMTGVVRDDTWTWTVGGLIYATITGTTGNTLSQTAPTVAGEQVQVVGVATHADRMTFTPSLVLVTI